MNSYNSYIGKTFGCLTINSITKVSKNSQHSRVTSLVAHCSCKCGNNNYSRVLTSINLGKVPCCNKCYKGIPLNSFIGKRYGQLTVIGAYNDGQHKYFKLKCICTNIVERNISEIVDRIESHSCGECYNGIRYKDYIGKIFGTYTIIDVYNKKKKGAYAKIKCTCNREYERKITLIDLNTKHKGCPKCDNGKPWESHIGEKYGNLTITGITHSSERGYSLTQMICKCDCGNENIIRTLSSLKARSRKASCGECYHGIPFSSFIGKNYGRLTIIEYRKNKNSSIRCIEFLCKCSCNKSENKWYPLEMINQNFKSISSCGCVKKELYNLRKIHFGSLHIMNTSKNNEGGLRYNCKCDCSREIEVLESDLFTGKVTCCNECLIKEE